MQFTPLSSFIRFIERVEKLATTMGSSLRIRGFKAGGTSGQVPRKNSSADFDWSWSGVGWNDVSGKPTTFPPSSHTHTIANVTGLQTALDFRVRVDAPQAFSDPQKNQARTNIGAAWSGDVDNLNVALSGKANSAGAILTSVTLSSGAIRDLGFVQPPILGMTNNQPASNSHVSQARATRVPLAVEWPGMPPLTASFRTVLVYPNNYMNSTADSVYYGTYVAQDGEINGKPYYRGGFNNEGEVYWDSTSSVWIMSSTLSPITWSKNNTSLDSNAPWIPSSSPQGQASGDMIVTPQKHQPGQMITFAGDPDSIYFVRPDETLVRIAISI